MKRPELEDIATALHFLLGQETCAASLPHFLSDTAQYLLCFISSSLIM